MTIYLIREKVAKKLTLLSWEMEEKSNKFGFGGVNWSLDSFGGK